jgi:hypothetical protein
MYDCLLGLADLSSEYCQIDYHYNDCEKAIYSAIDKEFERVTPTQEYFDRVDALPAVIKAKYHFARVQKIDNIIYTSYYGAHSWQSSRLDGFIEVLEDHIDEVGDLDIIFPIWDELHSAKDSKYDEIFYSGPILTVNYNKVDALRSFGGKNLILIPDVYVIRNSEYSYKVNYLTQEAYNDDFKPTIDKALFRGGCNAGGGNKVGIDKLNTHPRLKIPILTHLFQDSLDAKIIGMPSDKDPYTPAAKLGKLMLDLFGKSDNDYMKLNDQINYKYIISMDGHASSWSRPQTICFTKSLLLYQTDFIQWFQPALVAFKHYLPVKTDLSDLLERINWAKSHGDEVEEIIRNQNIVARKCFTPEKIEEQLVYIIKKYAAKFNYKPTNKGFPKYSAK